MSETITTSSTGGRKGVKPERHSLVPTLPLAQVARVYEYGSRKYADHNWRKGYEWSKSYDALQRHIQAFWGGEDLDPESGLPHPAHAVFHLFALLQGMSDHPEFDDRYVSAEAAAEARAGRRSGDRDQRAADFLKRIADRSTAPWMNGVIVRDPWHVRYATKTNE
jgi:hypothetical protein